TDSTTVNLYKALWAAREMNSTRSTLLVEANCFPTDIYISDSVAKQFGALGVQTIDSGEDALPDALGSDVAVCLLNAVDYRSGRLRDLEADTARVRSSGAVVVWDLSHATGVVPLELDRWEVDFAVGCTYKYLNGGPGAPAFLYAARKHHESMQQPLQGWWGHSRPFDFTSEFEAPPNIARMLCGTQGILSMRSIGTSLDIFDEVRINDIRHKSVALTDLFMRLLDPVCDAFGMRISTPRDADSRGSQVALCHPEAYALVQAMIEHGVVGDFRAPDTLHFGFAPLYLRYSDVWCAAELLREVFEQSLWQVHQSQDRKAVT
ncbi:MAG: aminotransferase class V-fold PLP-dependent enzyme, partial [Pseudomonadota bacterium]